MVPMYTILYRRQGKMPDIQICGALVQFGCYHHRDTYLYTFSVLSGSSWKNSGWFLKDVELATTAVGSLLEGSGGMLPQKNRSSEGDSEAICGVFLQVCHHMVTSN